MPELPYKGAWLGPVQAADELAADILRYGVLTGRAVEVASATALWEEAAGVGEPAPGSSGLPFGR